MFVAGLEFLSEIFVAGVDVEVDDENGIIGRKEEKTTGAKGVVNGGLKIGME